MARKDTHPHLAAEVRIFVPMSVTRILVLRFSSIGDIVLTTPVVRQLHAQLEGEVEIHYCTRAAYAPLVKHHPAVHTVHAFKTDLTEVLDALMGTEFHYVIDLHRNVRSSIAKRKVKALDFTLDKRNVDKWLLVRFGVDRLKGQHIVERYLATVKAFGLEDDGQGLDLYIPEADRVPASALPAIWQPGHAALAIGAAHEGKRMNEEQLTSICDLLESPVVLLGGPDDAELGARIAEQAGNHVWNACGAFSILGSADLARQAGVLIAGDTGLMHIATAVQTPVISVWGCTTPSIGMSPWRPAPGSAIVEPIGRTKRPCSKLGNRCKYGMANCCISTVEPERIADHANQVLEA